jgi:hypothetical protein
MNALIIKNRKTAPVNHKYNSNEFTFLTNNNCSSRDLKLFSDITLLHSLSLDFVFLVVTLDGFFSILFIIDGETSVLNESGHASLEVFHVFGEGIHDNTLLLAGLHALGTGFLSSTELARVNSPSDNESQNDGNERSEDSESLGVFLKEGRNAKEDHGHQDEHDGNVEEGESTPDAGGLSKLTGAMQRKGAHERNGVENENTSNVEEQVRKSNLKRLSSLRNHGGENGSSGGSDIGTKGEREHLLKAKDTVKQGKTRESEPKGSEEVHSI